MISDYLKAKLADEIPGILTATAHLEGGKQIIRINGWTAIVGPFASDNEVEAGIRLALNIHEPEHDDMVDSVAFSVATAASLLPSVSFTKEKPMANLTGGYKPGSLKALLQGARERTEAVMAGAVADIGDLHKALDHVENVAKDAKQTTNDIRAELGQFTNMPDDDETQK